MFGRQVHVGYLEKTDEHYLVLVYVSAAVVLRQLALRTNFLVFPLLSLSPKQLIGSWQSSTVMKLYE